MADSDAPSAGRVFISYRREETAWQAGWLFDRLADRYGRDQIFKDIDSIRLGDDFVKEITTAVSSCDVLLALIGEQWLTITDEHGQARLDNPDDFVRLEIEAALTRNVRVIPILIERARMPHADQLPPSLATLARRQALELSPSHFESDTSRLLKVLDSTLAPGARRTDIHRARHGRDPPRHDRPRCPPPGGAGWRSGARRSSACNHAAPGPLQVDHWCLGAVAGRCGMAGPWCGTAARPFRHGHPLGPPARTPSGTA
jgi:TIR domain